MNLSKVKSSQCITSTILSTFRVDYVCKIEHEFKFLSQINFVCHYICSYYQHVSHQSNPLCLWDIVQEIHLQLAFSTHVKSKYPYYVGEGGELLSRTWQGYYLMILLVVVLLFFLLSFPTPPPTALHTFLFHTLGSQQGCQTCFFLSGLRRLSSSEKVGVS